MLLCLQAELTPLGEAAQSVSLLSVESPVESPAFDTSQHLSSVASDTPVRMRFTLRL